MKKKMLALTLAVLSALSLTACGGQPAESSQSAQPSAESYTVGICQLTKHDALDAASQGFIDEITQALGEENVTFYQENAAGDPVNCSTICGQFVTEGVDLILANATPALQSAAAATGSIPVLGTAITEYGVALNLADFNGTVGGNISGTSDLADLAAQAAMLQELFPDAGNVGLLYCSGEPNSAYQIDVVQKELEGMGYQVERYSFVDSNDVTSVTKAACDASDVLYIPTDNTAASNTEAINNVALPAGVPIVCGDFGTCAGCGVAALAIDYYDLGTVTGKMAVKILTGEADISTMPVEYVTDVAPVYNAEICEALGVSVPENYEALP